jgi:DNA-directed RNA polymerase specialized sigma24 family protein
VLVLSSIEELSVKEIGRVVGRSERAVHSLLHRAKAKARERLADHE